MKYLDKLINFIFSLLILVLTVIVVLVSAGFMDYEIVDAFIRNNIFSVENNTITCIVAIVLFLMALKTTFFLSRTNNKKKAAIMVDTANGKIQIASETIENTAKNVAKNYEQVKDAQVRMIKEKRAINVYMVLLVLPHTNIIELSSKVQDEAKEAIYSTTGVKVNNVDIKIKNIAEGRNASNKVKPQKVNDVKVETIKNEDVINNENINDTESSIVEENAEVVSNNENVSVENSEENKNE